MLSLLFLTGCHPLTVAALELGVVLVAAVLVVAVAAIVVAVAQVVGFDSDGKLADVLLEICMSPL